MLNGNILVDRMDIENDIRTFKCRDCDGNGYIPWHELEDWQTLMSEQIDDKVFKAMKKLGRISFYAMLQIARIVRKSGKRCGACDGCGEVYI